MSQIAFTKGHGTGNDFLVLHDSSNQLQLTPNQIAKLCDRHFGLGANGVLRAIFDSVWFMDYRNADGTIAEMCGNGIRVFAEYLFQRNLIESVAEIKTRGGMKRVERVGENMWSVEMGRVHSEDQSAQILYRGTSYQATAVNVGNPHMVIHLDSLEALPSSLLWPDVDNAGAHPDGFNLEFYVANSATSVSMRVLERGVGETLSCGTGACAVGYVHMQRGGQSKCEVRVPGGNLSVELVPDGIKLIGPVELVANGFVELT